MTQNEKWEEMQDIGLSIAADAYNSLVDGGDRKESLELIDKGLKIAEVARAYLPKSEMSEIESERHKALENDLLMYQVKQIESEVKNAKKEKIWDRSLKIASIAAPIGVAITTGVVGAILFKQKSDLVNETIKLNTVLQEKGCITGLNNSKIVSDSFNELLKK